MTILLLVATVLGLAALLGVGLFALVVGARVRAVLALGAAGVLAAVYGAALLATSLASREATLPPGATKHFCGFYLDCHVGVAVLDDSVVPAIAGRAAAGRFHVLTLRVSSSARRETLTPWDLRLQLVDAGGSRIGRDEAAEAALGAGGTLERPIPAGGGYDIQVVFDVPAEAAGLRLFADQGPPVKLPELFLIGDEASVLHRKTLLALRS